MDSGALVERYAALSSAVARLDDRSLASLLGPTGRSGWGSSGSVTIDGHDVFVKRIPVTELETRRRWSTKNVHQLPVFYSYGVGSAGFGAHRELVTHVHATGWVLAGETDGFPMLVHSRTLPRRATGPDAWIGGDDYVRYWNGSRRIGRYIEARAAATEELCLVLEHVPHSLHAWLVDHQGDAPRLLGRLCDALRFLHARDVLHLDAHFGNVVTDGERLCLTDFGLALDASFELSPPERAFFAGHQHYDFGEAIANLGSLLGPLVDRTDPATKAAIEVAAEIPPSGQRVRPLARHLPRLVDEGLLDVHPELCALIVRYREVIDAMWQFFEALRSNRRKDTPWDDDRMRSLIHDAGGLPGAGG